PTSWTPRAPSPTTRPRTASTSRTPSSSTPSAAPTQMAKGQSAKGPNRTDPTTFGPLAPCHLALSPDPPLMPKKKIALAYSGDLATSAHVPWLKEHEDCDVVCVVGDVGQGSDELAGVEQKAKNSGASACHVVDLKRDFIENYVYPTVLAGAVYEGKYLLGTSM